MKTILFVILMFTGLSTFASFDTDPSLNIMCISEDGSAFDLSVVNASEVNSLQVKVREGDFKEINNPQLTAFNWEKKEGKFMVKSLVLTSNQKIIVALVNDTYVDEIGGSYELIGCIVK